MLQKISKALRSIKHYSHIMSNNAVTVNALTIICILLCFSFNYTFPLYRESSSSSFNSSNYKYIPAYQSKIVDRTKKMASNIENAFKRFKDSTQDFGKSLCDHVNAGLKLSSRIVNEDDLRHYEQLVIMKKYPYLDLKELEYRPMSIKSPRNSIRVDTNYGDPSLSEPIEDGPNVEITNRGLSGFAIPPHLSNQKNLLMENKSKSDNLDNNFEIGVNSKNTNTKQSSSSVQNMLGSLKSDVKDYVERKLIKPI